MVICFDGRLDNRAELLALLGARGAVLARAPDSAIVLALFEALGDDMVKALAGDFAIAIWQPRERRLFLARSPLGWRPLLWCFDGATFGFATEPRALVVGLGLERRLNEGAIGEYLSARFVSQTETFWQGVQRLPQGSALALEDGRVRQWHWHDGPFEDLSGLSEADHVALFRELFDQALIACTRGSTAVNAQLSGGLDSSSVVCRATELHRAGRIERQIGAISARFPGQSYDESPYSGAVEAHLGITARVVGPVPFDAVAARSWCAESLQLPLRPNVLDTAVGALRMIEAEGGRVMLTGEGGDDWMDGSLAHWPDMLRGGRWIDVLREGLGMWSAEPLHVRLRRTIYHSGMPLVNRRYRDRLLRPNIDFAVGAPPWIRPDWAARIGLTDRWRSDALPLDLPGFAQRQRYGVFRHARRHINVDAYLAYAESHGVEIRHPLHDLRLTRFFMGAAGGVLRRNGVKKHLLREAMRGTLPEMVRNRTDKAHFMASMVDAATDLFRERPPRELLVARMGWVDGDRLGAYHAVFQRWRESGSTGPAPREIWGPVWFALAMDMWLEHAFRL